MKFKVWYLYGDNQANDELSTIIVEAGSEHEAAVKACAKINSDSGVVIWRVRVVK